LEKLALPNICNTAINTTILALSYSDLWAKIKLLAVPYRNTGIPQFQETSMFHCFLGRKDTSALHMVPTQLEFPEKEFQTSMLISHPNKAYLLV
jgi:hypothetical protein